MKAFLKNYRQSPRKVRLVADAIKGKGIVDAENTLQFLVKRASDPMMKLLQSAIANARANNNVDRENLYVADVRVDKGIVLKRMMPRARGSASRINKRTSHVIIELKERTTEKKAKKADAPKKELKAKKPAKAKKEVTSEVK
jgi:large subunit ribosomal protein L22